MHEDYALQTPLKIELQSTIPSEFTRIRLLRPSNNKAPEQTLVNSRGLGPSDLPKIKLQSATPREFVMIRLLGP